MCMFSKTRFPLRAREDIIVYKEFRMKDKLFLCTPVRGIKVPDQKEWPFVMIPDCRPPLRFSKEAAYIKGEGYIHAFTYKVQRYNYLYPEIRLVECIIPKGTKYHLSKSGKEICARKLILMRIIK